MNIGEIDFIVAGTLTSVPAKAAKIEGETVQLETIPEIIAKKIYYRGSTIKPRDIFDIAAAGEKHLEVLVKELRPFKERVTEALAVMERLKPDFVANAIEELAISEEYKALAKNAQERAKEILRAV